jgi:NADH:ubiquinone oxidoreductase subunit 6 (subunit J)
MALFYLISTLFLFFNLRNPNWYVNYFYPSWSIEFKTMTDIETLANILYVGYPIALILISVALWIVMIGIIKVVTVK